MAHAPALLPRWTHPDETERSSVQYGPAAVHAYARWNDDALAGLLLSHMRVPVQEGRSSRAHVCECARAVAADGWSGQGEGGRAGGRGGRVVGSCDTSRAEFQDCMCKCMWDGRKEDGGSGVH